MKRGQSRAEAYLAAIAYLVLSGQEGIAHAYLEAAHPEIAAYCRLEGTARPSKPPLADEAAALVHDLTCPLWGDTGSDGSTP